MKLGKNAPKQDYRTLRLCNYLNWATLPAVPVSVNYYDKVSSFPVYLNDQIGDCGPAGLGHEVQVWTANAGKEVKVTDNDVLKLYEAVSGYIPGRPNTDVGINILDMLRYVQKNGLAGHKIGPYCQLDITNINEFKLGTYLFGGVAIGVALPKAAQSLQIWDNPTGSTRGGWAPGSWGGHYVPIVGYDGSYYYVVTWGQVMKMTPLFLKLYCDEAWTIFTPDWISGGKAPNGFDIVALNLDLQDISNQTPIGPPIQPPVNPPVNPPVDPPVNPPSVGTGDMSLNIDGKVTQWRVSKLD